MFPLPPSRQFLQFRDPFLRIQFPGCSHRRFGLLLLVLRQSLGDVPQLVLAAPLHQARTSETALIAACNAFEPSITNRCRSGSPKRRSSRSIRNQKLLLPFRMAVCSRSAHQIWNSAAALGGPEGTRDCGFAARVTNVGRSTANGGPGDSVSLPFPPANASSVSSSSTSSSITLLVSLPIFCLF